MTTIQGVRFSAGCKITGQGKKNPWVAKALQHEMLQAGYKDIDVPPMKVGGFEWMPIPAPVMGMPGMNQAQATNHMAFVTEVYRQAFAQTVAKLGPLSTLNNDAPTILMQRSLQKLEQDWPSYAQKLKLEGGHHHTMTLRIAKESMLKVDHRKFFVWPHNPKNKAEKKRARKVLSPDYKPDVPPPKPPAQPLDAKAQERQRYLESRGWQHLSPKELKFQEGLFKILDEAKAKLKRENFHDNMAECMFCDYG